MKAYLVRDEKRDEDYCAVVFGETRGKAIQAALRTDACEDGEWTDIRAIRVPELDSYYRGREEMDWFDDNDRIGMVRYAGMRCSDEMSIGECGCEDCPAKEFCSRYEDEMEDEADADE